MAQPRVAPSPAACWPCDSPAASCTPWWGRGSKDTQELKLGPCTGACPWECCPLLLGAVCKRLCCATSKHFSLHTVELSPFPTTVIDRPLSLHCLYPGNQERTSRGLLVQLPTQAGTPRAACPGPCPDSEVAPKMEAPQPLRANCSYAQSPSQ